MADDKAIERLQQSIKSYGGAAEWNNYRSVVGPLDLSQANLGDADLKDHNFSRCNLVAARLFNTDLTGADLTEARLSYADLRRANLANSYCSHADFKVAKLQGANFVDADLTGADLSSAHCGGAYLVGANLAGANLSGADLRGANLKFANLEGATVDKTKVEDADLTGVKLTKDQIKAFHGFDQAIIRQKPAREATARKKIAPEEDHEDLFLESDCYKILGVSPEASLDDIEKAYRRRIKEYHPDRVNTLGDKLKIVAQREFQRVQHAYRSLTHHRSKPPVAVSRDALAAARLDETKTREYTVEDYLNLVKVQPENDSAHYNLGIKYFQKGLIDLAIQSYRQAISLNPKNEDAAHNLKLAELAKALGGN